MDFVRVVIIVLLIHTYRRSQSEEEFMSHNTVKKLHLFKFQYYL